MAYPDGPLKNRSVIKPGEWAVISPEGRVINTVPGFEDCKLTILATPKIGASFIQLIGAVGPKGRTTRKYAPQPHEESFIYVMDGKGELKVTLGNKTETLKAGGYAYATPGTGIAYENANGKECRMLLYKQRYVPHPDGRKPHDVFGDANKIKYADYADMTNVHLKDLLPVDEAFDMNMHILSFDPGACHPIVETHVQEHGAYLLEGEGLYWMGSDWIHVKAEDFMWFGPYTKQACYATGRGPLTYIYSKDCNRDVEI
jgi:(S)-ureidoglycine aminohydrolase